MKLEMTSQDQSVKLTQTLEKHIVTKISDIFEKLSSARSAQLQDIKLLKTEIYSQNEPANNVWHNYVNLPDIYELAQTLKSHLIENIYSHPEAMFDVAGSDPNSQTLANKQKAMLVDSFEKMKFGLEVEKIVDSIVETGEASVFIGWNTLVKQVRRQKSPMELISDPQDSSPSLVESKVIYDGAVVKFIPAQDFVFDVELKDFWDKCPKIYRTYQDLDQITNNESFNTLSPLKEDSLKELFRFAKKLKSSDAVKDDRIEILEYWGDFVLADGKVLKNWLIVVAGRSCVIRFEPNPFIINPFVYANVIEDPCTGRGISPLRIAVSLNKLSSTILNKQLDALSLIINPPYLAPKGCFKGEQDVKPGKIIEYDAALMPNQPIPIKFDSALRGWDFIQHFKASIESATGIFKNMAGNIAPQQRTATELTYSLSGQAVRLSMMIDSINRKLIIPIVEKTADIISNFKFGTETISAKGGNGINFLEIDDNVRNACYIYRYGDRKASLERKYRFKELFETISAFSKIPEVTEKIDWLECFKFTLEQYGIENSENFLKDSAGLTQIFDEKTERK